MLAAVENPSLKVPLAEPQWLACMTGARREFDADLDLRRKGLWTWLPFERVRIRKKMRGTLPTSKEWVWVPEWVNRPYFNRYIFVALRYQNDSISTIEASDHISIVVRRRFSREPLRIPSGVMAELMQRADEDGMISSVDLTGMAELRVPFQKGEIVTVRKGHALENFLVEVSKDGGGPKLRAWATVLNSRREVEFRAEDLERVDKAAAAA